MKTITFYSFKGGVGRSLTLSNMALWLADEMKAKVCVIDFDLEAPGLPYKFEDLQNPTDQERLSRTEGIVEYIDEFKQTGLPPTDFTRFYLPFTTKKGNPITLIPAGNLQQSDYWRKLFEINWQKLFEHDPAMGYSQGLLLLEDLKGRIENELKPDFLLIDSRTGLTEIASITLKLLADKAVLVGINNPENQDGLFWVLRSLHADPASRDLPYHLVLNRVPMQHGTGRKEIDPREKAIGEQFLKRFEPLAPLEVLAQRFSIIHADDELAFGEKLQEGFYVEAQSKVQTRKDYWDVFTQVVKEYFSAEQWGAFENKRRAYELYYKADFDNLLTEAKIDLMNEAIGYCDDDAFLYNYRFILFYESDNKTAALNDIRRATEIESDNEALWNNLGITYDSQQAYDSAVESYRKALEIKPDSHDVWNNLGNTYSHQQAYDLAEEAFRKALDLQPKAHEIWYNLGVTYYRQQAYDSAVESYRKALEIKPDYHEAWYNLGVTYYRQQAYDLVVESYRKSLEIKPDNHEAWNNLGNTYARQQAYDLVVESYRKALEIKPDDHEAWNNLGTAYACLKAYDLAVEAYRKSLEIKPDDHEAWNNLGNTYARQQAYDSAVEAYRKVLEIKPDKRGALNNLANILVKLSFLQREPQKTETLQNALQVAQKSQQLGGRVYNLACVCAILNDKTQTLHWLQEALKRKEMSVDYVKEDQDFASLHEDEDFKALLARFS